MTVGRLMDALYVQYRFDDLDVDAVWQRVGKGKRSVLNYLDNYASDKH